ncbi:hypothetical protein RhiirA5_423940 [Rhizophagus irregularis]|uniref:Uncharacterized protein n=1 Tax=Rhizophagus irregularis TaxID=588596 RepID=A0A2N0P906_9GLOM|nr:hypothetical protein RhiirA5_423940 [Rhizophagus irregularis]
MENIVLNTNFSYNNLYDSSDPLFNSYYDSSYNDSDLLSNSHHNSSVDTFNPLFNFLYDFSDLFLENDEIANEIQIGNESLVDFLKDHMKDRQKDRNESINIIRNHLENYHYEEEYDNSEYESERDRDSEMIGCSWHINLAFPRSSNGVQINSIISKHNYDMNPLVRLPA